MFLKVFPCRDHKGRAAHCDIHNPVQPIGEEGISQKGNRIKEYRAFSFPLLSTICPARNIPVPNSMITSPIPTEQDICCSIQMAMADTKPIALRIVPAAENSMAFHFFSDSFAGSISFNR